MNNSPVKFADQKITAKGQERAYVDLQNLETLWFNTGSICNLACKNCYIESNPRNDRLSFITAADVQPFLIEIKQNLLGTKLIGLTGGEPFTNPHIIEVLNLILTEGFEVLILTNAYKVLKRFHSDLNTLNEQYPEKLHIRVSLDHYTKVVHEGERGIGTFDETLRGISWLVQSKFNTSLAGRSLIKESVESALFEYQKLMDHSGIPMSLSLGMNIMIFPEMNLEQSVPEITTACWSLLQTSPLDQMCAHERMIIKKKADSEAVVMPCTLLAYDTQFELGRTLEDASKRVYLNHPFCAQFCVLGGASCSPKL